MKNIYFIGIGGSGMFGLASLALKKGWNVSGSDIVSSENTDKLIDQGVKIFFEQLKENIDANIDLVVYSGAIKEDNPEVLDAKRLNIKVLSRSEFLGFITSEYENLIAIAGSHGKTTVTSMITGIMLDAGKDPTSIIGAKFDKIDGNSRLGKSNFAVCEACEYLDSFLDLDPKLGVILNVDNDHLDYFKNLENEKKSFLKFAQKCDVIVVNSEDSNSYELSKYLENKKVIYYGFSKEADIKASNISLNLNGTYSFDILCKDKKISNISLNIPGKHNILNALASFAVALYFKLDTITIKKSVENFSGANRRFQLMGTFNGITVFDDFAHHPTEIEATLKTAKSMKFKRIWAVFQPHTFSRTYLLLNEFAKALAIADKLIITDILPVRELNTYGISSEDLSKKIPGSLVIKDFHDVADYIKKHAQSGDMVITIGGGNIYKCAKLILE